MSTQKMTSVRAKPNTRTAKTAVKRIKPRPSTKVVQSGYNVFDAALDRIRWLFNEFDGDVAVSNSGGKDSTVILELAAIVAAERGELPLKVVFLDQECEFQGTVDYQRYLLNERNDIDFHWYQVPFKLFNATNSENPWLNVWDADLADRTPISEGGDGWVRAKEPNAIHESPFPKIDRFGDLLSRTNAHSARAVLTGMRGEESPNRRMTLISRPVYKWVTWGSKAPELKEFEGRFRFHPIYDWSYIDVWKAIHEHGWRYNDVYDHQYRYGVAVRNMRVSNYHHETALHSLTWLQEVEPATWEAATKRLQGINTSSHLGGREQMPEQLPHMFGSWDEYACYLIDNLIPDDEGREQFRKHRQQLINRTGILGDAAWGRQLVRAVVNGDRWGTTIDNWINARDRDVRERKQNAEDATQ